MQSNAETVMGILLLGIVLGGLVLFAIGSGGVETLATGHAFSPISPIGTPSYLPLLMSNYSQPPRHIYLPLVVLEYSQPGH